jgi:hypothetical protein
LVTHENILSHSTNKSSPNKKRPFSLSTLEKRRKDHIMNNNLNVSKGKKGFQKTTPKKVSPTKTPPQGYSIKPSQFLYDTSFTREKYAAMHQFFKANEELLTQLTQEFEDEGMPTSDAQAAAQAEIILRETRKTNSN